MEQQLPTISSWLTTNSNPVETLVFYVLATLAIPFAYGVIFDRAIIRSGFLLIGMFGAVSGLFLLLQAQFSRHGANHDLCRRYHPRCRHRFDVDEPAAGK